MGLMANKIKKKNVLYSRNYLTFPNELLFFVVVLNKRFYNQPALTKRKALRSWYLFISYVMLIIKDSFLMTKMT